MGPKISGPKNFCLKKFSVKKILGKKNLAPRKIRVPNNFSSKKMFWSKRNFGKKMCWVNMTPPREIMSVTHAVRNRVLKWVVCHFCRTSSSIWTKKKFEEKSSTFSAIRTFFPLELFSWSRPVSVCQPKKFKLGLSCAELSLGKAYEQKLAVI